MSKIIYNHQTEPAVTAKPYGAVAVSKNTEAALNEDHFLTFEDTFTAYAWMNGLRDALVAAGFPREGDV